MLSAFLRLTLEFCVAPVYILQLDIRQPYATSLATLMQNENMAMWEFSAAI